MLDRTGMGLNSGASSITFKLVYREHNFDIWGSFHLFLHPEYFD